MNHLSTSDEMPVRLKLEKLFSQKSFLTAAYVVSCIYAAIGFIALSTGAESAIYLLSSTYYHWDRLSEHVTENWNTSACGKPLAYNYAYPNRTLTQDELETLEYLTDLAYWLCLYTLYLSFFFKRLLKNLEPLAERSNRLHKALRQHFKKPEYYHSWAMLMIFFTPIFVYYHLRLGERLSRLDSNSRYYTSGELIYNLTTLHWIHYVYWFVMMVVEHFYKKQRPYVHA